MYEKNLQYKNIFTGHCLGFIGLFGSPGSPGKPCASTRFSRTGLVAKVIAKVMHNVKVRRSIFGCGVRRSEHVVCRIFQLDKFLASKTFPMSLGLNVCSKQTLLLNVVPAKNLIIKVLSAHEVRIHWHLHKRYVYVERFCKHSIGV